MRLGRHEILLIAGLIFALSVVFSAQTMKLLRGIRAFEGDYGVGVLPGLALAAATLVFYFHGKRRQLQVRASTAAQEAARAHDRARELERLITFWQALTQSFDLDAIRDVVELYLPELAGTQDGWVVIAQDGGWQPLLGRRFLLRDGVSTPTSDVAAAALERAGLIARPDGIEHDGHVCFPLIAAGSTLGVLGLPADLPGLTQARRFVIGAAAALFAVSLRSVQLLEEVRQNSLRDSLTGCVNRGHAMEVVDAEMHRARRSRHPVSMILFDVDRFKQVNDRYGHLCGDAVLAEIGARMRSTLRGSDLKCRYGGEEFMVLLPDTPLEGARRVAENLRREIGAMGIPWNGDPIHVTSSFGVATARPDELDPKALIARADEALYAAKRDGRDCVRLADEVCTAAEPPTPA
jgi:diguanylate cyclase (GGDEF)-like protein